MHNRQRIAALIGALLAVCVTVRVILLVPHPGSSVWTFTALIVLGIGGPITLPWAYLTLRPRSLVARTRRLAIVESVVCIVLIAYQVVLLVFLPQLVNDSEGFVLPYVWGLAAASTVVLLLVGTPRHKTIRPRGAP
jgi:hypothetical protein